MIEIIQGRGVGAGKSYYACTRIIQHVLKGGTVVLSDNYALKWEKVKRYAEWLDGTQLEDDQVIVVPAEETHRFHELTPQGTDELPVMAVLDEAHMQLNSRDWADKSKRSFFDWLTQSRHDDVDVVFITQHAHNIDKQIARLATYITNVRNMAMFKVLGLGAIPWRKNQFRINQYDQDGKTLLDAWYIKKDRRIFGCYESKSMRGKHKRNGVIASKKTLQKKDTKKMKIYGIIGAVVLTLLIAAAVLYKMFGSGIMKGAVEQTTQRPIERPKEPPAPPVKPQASTKEKAPPVAYMNQSLVATDNETFMVTTQDEYRKGQNCMYGFVRNISPKGVEIETLTGGSLVVRGMNIPIKPRERIKVNSVQTTPKVGFRLGESQAKNKLDKPQEPDTVGEYGTPINRTRSRKTDGRGIPPIPSVLRNAASAGL